MLPHCKRLLMEDEENNELNNDCPKPYDLIYLDVF